MNEANRPNYMLLCSVGGRLWAALLWQLLWCHLLEEFEMSAASETNKSRLQRQTWAAQLISGTGPRDSRNPVFKELGWLSLESGRFMHKCTMVFKYRNGLAPPYLIYSFNTNIFNHSYSTRNSSKLRVPIARTEYYSLKLFSIWM